VLDCRSQLVFSAVLFSEAPCSRQYKGSEKSFSETQQQANEILGLETMQSHNARISLYDRRN
jgi:hypothetical protein